jgi:hypothetical protein
MLRPCLHCGYRSEPREGGACPECGTPQPPASWVIVEVSIPPHVRRWFLVACTVGIGFPLLMVAVPLLFGTSTFGSGCLGLFPILFVPVLLRKLFSRSALGQHVIRDDGIASSVLGPNRICRSSEGWRVAELTRDGTDPHRWLLVIARSGSGAQEGQAHSEEERFEIPIDDRVDDPHEVARAARRVLTPELAFDTSGGAG